MWNSKKSVLLSLTVTYIAFAVLIAVMAIAPTFVDFWYGERETLKRVLLATFYTCCPFGFATLYGILRLLCNIKNEKVFVEKNIFYLRLISWCCFAVACVTFAGGTKYLPFLLVSSSAMFLGLILRVVKNVMCSAMELKKENELTI